MFLKPLKAKVSLPIIFLLSFIISNNLQSSEIAKKKTEKLHETLLINNSSEKPLAQRLDDLKITIDTIFDYKKMIKFIYGKKWTTLDDEIKEKLEKTFLRYISYNYAKRFSAIKNLKFKIVKNEKLSDTKVLIKTFMITSGKDTVSFDYIFNKKDGDWKIFDILVEGSISEVATKKSDFYQIIKQGGPLGLIEIINEKIGNY